MKNFLTISFFLASLLAIMLVAWPALFLAGHDAGLSAPAQVSTTYFTAVAAILGVATLAELRKLVAAPIRR